MRRRSCGPLTAAALRDHRDEVESRATLSNHAITETAASGVHEDAAHDRLASTEHSAEVPSNRSSALPVAIETVKGKEGSRRDRALLYAVIPLAILMTAAAIWGWMRPEASKPVLRYTLMVDSTEAIAKAPSWAGRIALSPDTNAIECEEGLPMFVGHHLRTRYLRPPRSSATQYAKPDFPAACFVVIIMTPLTPLGP